MGDIVDRETRSRMMANIRSKNTKPERLLRSYLHKHGFRFRLHGSYKNGKLPGAPDIVLSKYKTVIFVHGCFWHGHKNCEHFRFPKSNTDFWTWKITRNRANDILHRLKLEEMGWNVITIWECQLKNYV